MITLDRLTNVLGGYGVRLHHCGVARTSELRSVVIPETVEGRVIAGDVLLAIGACTADEALAWAREAHAIVTLVRAEPPALNRDCGVAVMVIDPELAWSDVAAVVYGLVLEGRETESGRGPTDLFALADNLATQIGGATLIADQHGDVLAYSRVDTDTDRAHELTILNRELPTSLRESFERTGVYAHLAESDEPLFIPPDAGGHSSGRMVVAARAGRRLVGTAWVVCSEPLNDAAAQSLMTGARTVALHLLRSRASADLERQVESELVAQLLDGAADSATLASRLGLPQDGLRVVAVRAQRGAERHSALLLAFERMTAGFGWARPGRSALVGTTAYTVLPGDGAHTARDWLGTLTAAMPQDMTLLAGISAPATTAELASARQEADECLALQERTGPGAAAPAYDESWDAIVLGRLRTAGGSRRLPQRGPVSELRDHDRRHGTQYLTTLFAWLQAQGDPAAAGSALGVHENTVRYRLRRIADIADIRLDDPRKRLAMLIELEVTGDT